MTAKMPRDRETICRFSIFIRPTGNRDGDSSAGEPAAVWLTTHLACAGLKHGSNYSRPRPEGTADAIQSRRQSSRPAIFRDRRRNAQNQTGIRRASANRARDLASPAGRKRDLQFSRSPTSNRDADKLRSQISFLSLTPRADLEALAQWARRHGMDAEVGSHSDREFYLDAPAALVDFVIEAMRPELADYGSP